MPSHPAKAELDKSQRMLAQNIKRRRRELKLTVKAASRRAHLHWRHWQKIEAANVNVTLDTLTRLTLALDVKLHVLLLPSERVPAAEQRAAQVVEELLANPALRDGLVQRIAQELQ